MRVRAVVWLGLLVALLLAALLYRQYWNALEVAVIEVDNRSGQPLDGIVVAWNDRREQWPGVADGQSALIRIALGKRTEVHIELAPGPRLIQSAVAPGDRVSARVMPDSLQVRVAPDSAQPK